MANIKQQNYLNRDYTSIRNDLVQILKTYYPDQWQDFNSPGVGMSLVDLLAYVSDLLSYYTDKRFNELFLDGATEKSSIYRLARTLGYNPPGYRPAISLADISIEVPPTITGPDVTYLPVYRPGVQLMGAGQVFETIYEIDFSSDFSEEGTANRLITPIFNSNQDILRYRVTKREVIKAGVTKTFSRTITDQDANTPFLEVTLPDTNVLEILNVIAKTTTNNTVPPTYAEFNDFDLSYYEVESLAQRAVFLEDDSQTSSDNLKIGTYVEVPRRFIKEFMSDGSCKITFGGGTPDTNAYEEYLTKLPIGQGGEIDVSQTLNNDALGEMLQGSSTLYVKYRVGGGVLSNVASNTLTQAGNIDAVILGANSTTNANVISSTRVINIIPAIGGLDLPSTDEIRQYIASNFASQKRGVTLEDYIARAYQMPGKFGTPFRIYGKVDENKVKMYILTTDANGKLLATSTNTIKNNLKTYLSAYRMVNDYIELNDGKIIDISLSVDIFIDKNFNSNEIKTNVINSVKNFFDVNGWQMNQNIYVSQITDLVKSIPGVINVIDIRFYNMEGGSYSNTLISQASGIRELTTATGVFRTEIELVNNEIFSTPISMFQIRYPELDIFVRTS